MSAVSMEDVAQVSSGTWMMKPGSKSSSWKLGIGGAWARRHVWYQGNAVHYGPKEKKSEKSVPMEDISTVRAATREEVLREKGPENLSQQGFWLVAADKTILFCAEKEADRALWLRVLGSYVARRKGTTAAASSSPDVTLRHRQDSVATVTAQATVTDFNRSQSAASAGSPQSEGTGGRAKSQSVISNFNSDEIDALIEEESDIREGLEQKSRKIQREIEGQFFAEIDHAVNAEAERITEERAARARQDEAARREREEASRAVEEQQFLLCTEPIERHTLLTDEQEQRLLMTNRHDSQRGAIAAIEKQRAQAASEEARQRQHEARAACGAMEAKSREEHESLAQDGLVELQRQAQNRAQEILRKEAARLDEVRERNAQELDRYMALEQGDRTSIVEAERQQRRSIAQDTAADKSEATKRQVARIADASQRAMLERELQRSKLLDEALSMRQVIAAAEEDAFTGTAGTAEREHKTIEAKLERARAKAVADRRAAHRKAVAQLEQDEVSARPSHEEDAARRSLWETFRASESATRSSERARIAATQLQQGQARAAAGDAEFTARLQLVSTSDAAFAALLGEAAVSRNAATSAAEARIRKETETREKRHRLAREQVTQAEATARSALHKDLAAALTLLENENANSQKRAAEGRKQRLDREAKDASAQAALRESEAGPRQAITAEELHSRKQLIGHELEAAEEAARIAADRVAKQTEAIRARHKTERLAMTQSVADDKDKLYEECCKELRATKLNKDHEFNQITAQLAKARAELLERMRANLAEFIAAATKECDEQYVSLVAKEAHERQSISERRQSEGTEVEARAAAFRQSVGKILNISNAAAQGIHDAEAHAFETLAEEEAFEKSAILQSPQEAQYHARQAERRRQEQREAELVAHQREELRKKRLLEEEAFMFVQEGCWTHKPGSASNKPGASSRSFFSGGTTWQKRYIWVAGDDFLYGAKQLVGDNTIPLRTVRKVMVSSAADAKKDNCPKDMQNLVFRIDTWDKYYLFACGSARDRELLVRFFQWRTKQNASDDDDDDDGDGASLMLAESVARFENSSTVSSPTASRRSVSPVGSHTSHTSPSNRGASQQQSLQQQQRSSFVVTDTRSSSGGATRATTSQRNLPPAPPPPPAPPAQALDGDVLDDVTFEEEAERIGLVVNIEIKARAAMLAAYKSFAGSTTAATATEEVKSTAGEQPAEAKAAAPLPSEPPAPAPPPPSTTNSPPNNSSSPAVTQTSSVNAPPAGTSANRRRASMSSSAGAAAVIIQQQQQRAEAELNRQRLQREMEAHAAFVTKGAWMHKPRSKPAGGASSLFNLGGSSWNKRFVWVANNRVCYGEKQGKVEKDVLLSTIRSVHVVSSDTMKAEKAPASMQELGWRLIAAERTIIFAAADAAARKHFVEFLSPKAVTPSSTKAGVRGGADDSRNEHLIDYADDYDEGQEDLYEEEEEEDPPFADADNAGGDNMAAMTLEGSRSGGGGDGSGVAGDGGRGGGERAPSATSSAAPSPSNRAANGGAASNQSLAGGVPLSPGLGPARRSSLVRAKALPVLGKPKEPEVPLATLRSFVSRVDDGVVLNKTDGLIGAALATGEGLVVRKVGGIDERFVGKAALVLSAASKLRSKQRIAVPAHVVVETDTGTVVTVGPCEDGKPGLIAISIVGPNR